MGTESSKRTYTKHSYSERCRVVELYGQGLGSKRIARLTGLDPSMVRRWIRRYRQGGLPGLMPYSQQPAPGSSRDRSRKEKDRAYREACQVYAGTLESMASITRRYRLPYYQFRYYVLNRHPELVALRERLRQEIY